MPSHPPAPITAATVYVNKHTREQCGAGDEDAVEAKGDEAVDAQSTRQSKKGAHSALAHPPARIPPRRALGVAAAFGARSELTRYLPDAPLILTGAARRLFADATVLVTVARALADGTFQELRRTTKPRQLTAVGLALPKVEAQQLGFLAYFAPIIMYAPNTAAGPLCAALAAATIPVIVALGPRTITLDVARCMPLVGDDGAAAAAKAADMIALVASFEGVAKRAIVGVARMKLVKRDALQAAVRMGVELSANDEVPLKSVWASELPGEEGARLRLVLVSQAP